MFGDIYIRAEGIGRMRERPAVWVRTAQVFMLQLIGYRGL